MTIQQFIHSGSAIAAIIMIQIGILWLKQSAWEALRNP